jgi:hypothetical protein
MFNPPTFFRVLSARGHTDQDDATFLANSPVGGQAHPGCGPDSAFPRDILID